MSHEASPQKKSEITDLLIAHRDGDREAFERLVPLVYEDLRLIARRQLARTGGQQATLNTTALVHEAYLKLVDQTRVAGSDRSHFYAIASRAMRQVIIDHARKRTAAKRGGGKYLVSLDRVELGVTVLPKKKQPPKTSGWLSNSFERLSCNLSLSRRVLRHSRLRGLSGPEPSRTGHARLQQAT